jgi:hypothetical protein
MRSNAKPLAEVGGVSLHFFDAASGENDVVPSLGEVIGKRAANSGGGAGDQGDSAVGSRSRG